MKILIASLLFLFLVGCGSGSQQQPTYYGNTLAIDSEFQPYVNSFVAQAQTQGTPVQINDLVMTMQPELDTDYEMGVCISYTGVPQEYAPPPTVNINLQYWVQLDQAGRETLIYHEMGHCVLYRGHRPDLNNNQPLSNMYAYNLSDVLYQLNYKQYMYELFHQTDLASALPILAPPSNGEPISIATTSTEDPGTGQSDTVAPSNGAGVQSKHSTKVIFDENNKIVGWKCDHDDN